MIELIEAEFGRLVDPLDRTGQLDDTIILRSGWIDGEHGLNLKIDIRFIDNTHKIGKSNV